MKLNHALAVALALVVASPAGAQEPPPAAPAVTTPAPEAGPETASTTTGAAAGTAPSDAPTSADVPVKDAALQEALRVYAKRAEEVMHREAHERFRDLANAHPDDIELQLWCARTAYYYGHRRLQAGDSDGCSRIATEGLRCAKRARQIDPTSYDAKYWWVMCRVKAGTSTGIRAALKAVKPMKTFLEKLIASDPRRFEGYMCLGVLYRELPSFISWGDDEKALEYLKKAETIAPRNPELLLELAEGWLKNDQEDKAIEYFKRVATSEVPPHMEWETEDARQWAKKRIKDIRD